MKTILFRSISVSLFLLCLTFSSFAEGEMGTGSLMDNGELKQHTTIQTKQKNDDSTTITERNFFGWITDFFTGVLS